MKAPAHRPPRGEARVKECDSCLGDLGNFHRWRHANVLCIEEEAADSISCAAQAAPQC